VLFGGDDGGPGVGVVRVEVPAGAVMPEHSHGGSDVVLVSVDGTIEITKGPDTLVIEAGDAALVRSDETVALRNPGAQAAEVLVAAGPPHFVAGIRQWPDAPADDPQTE
jgi:quercetin dioxygenase-like cupin family protein